MLNAITKFNVSRIWSMNDLRSGVGDDKLMLKGTHAEVRVLRKYL